MIGLLLPTIPHAARWLVLSTMPSIGVQVDEDANQSGSRRISRDESQVAVWVMATDEEFMIAQHTRCVLGL
jgi:acetate kinase